MKVQAPGRASAYPTGLPRRFGALIYDTLLVSIGVWGTTVLLLAIANGEAMTGLFVQLILLGEWLGFYAYFWHRRGQTLGMLCWSIRLVDEQGGQPTWRQISTRLLVAPISMLCFGIGFLWYYVGEGRQTWHDRASQTFVVHTPKRATSS